MYKQIIKSLKAVISSVVLKVWMPLCAGMLISFSSISLADSGKSNIPGIDRASVSYEVPADLDQWSTHEVSSLRDEHQANLDQIRQNQTSRDQADAHMLSELLRHDKVRLSIADVIPVLIDEYQIKGDFKDLLMGYRDTFKVELMANHREIQSLADYQSYDFRFSAVYMSMIYAFDANPEFYERLKSDMMLEDSIIGRYRKAIDESYMGVKAASEVIDSFHIVNDLEKVIVALDSELEKRNN